MQDDVEYLLDAFGRVSDHIARCRISEAKREIDRVVEEFEPGPVAQRIEHHASNVRPLIMSRGCGAALDTRARVRHRVMP